MVDRFCSEELHGQVRDGDLVMFHSSLTVIRFAFCIWRGKRGHSEYLLVVVVVVGTHITSDVWSIHDFGHVNFPTSSHSCDKKSINIQCHILRSTKYPIASILFLIFLALRAHLTRNRKSHRMQRLPVRIIPCSPCKCWRRAQRYKSLQRNQIEGWYHHKSSSSTWSFRSSTSLVPSICSRPHPPPSQHRHHCEQSTNQPAVIKKISSTRLSWIDDH